MAETFIALLAAHLIGDFLLQPGWIVKNKRRAPALILHIFIVTSLSAALLGAFNPVILGVIALTHLAADLIKARFLTDTVIAFSVDQIVHILVIAGLAVVFPDAFDNGVWPAVLGVQTALYLKALTIASGFVLSIPAGAHLIRKLTGPFRAELNEGEYDGLQKGGLYIGCLERGLVFVFVLTGQAAGVGLLITAKSLLRFGEIKDSAHRKVAEYIIIGTFASFGCALLVASLTNAALSAL